MQLSKAFVVTMGLVMVFLLTAFATEQGRCIARAKRLLGDRLPVVSAGKMAAADSGAPRVAPAPDSVRFIAACEAPEPPVKVGIHTPFGRHHPSLRPSLMAGDLGRGTAQLQ